MKTLVLAAVLALVGQTVHAEVIKAECQVRRTQPTSSPAGLRRLLIDTNAKMVRVWDNTGHGWKMMGAHPIVGVQGDRIVLDSGGGKTSSLDRRTGAYAFHNDADKVTLEGRCRRAK